MKRDPKRVKAFLRRFYEWFRRTYNQEHRKVETRTFWIIDAVLRKIDGELQRQGWPERRAEDIVGEMLSVGRKRTSSPLTVEYLLAHWSFGFGAVMDARTAVALAEEKRIAEELEIARAHWQFVTPGRMACPPDDVVLSWWKDRMVRLSKKGEKAT